MRFNIFNHHWQRSETVQALMCTAGTVLSMASQAEPPLFLRRTASNMFGTGPTTSNPIEWTLQMERLCPFHCRENLMTSFAIGIGRSQWIAGHVQLWTHSINWKRTANKMAECFC